MTQQDDKAMIEVWEELSLEERLAIFASLSVHAQRTNVNDREAYNNWV